MFDLGLAHPPRKVGRKGGRQSWRLVFRCDCPGAEHGHHEITTPVVTKVPSTPRDFTKVRHAR